MQSDENQIRELLHQCARAIDSKDWQLFEDCFTEEVQLTYGGSGNSPHAGGVPRTFADRAELVEYIRMTHQPLGHTLHGMSNVSITVDPPQDARARAYGRVVLTHEAHPEGNYWETAGYCEDRRRNDGSGWRISAHHLTRVWANGNQRILNVE